MPRGRKKKPKEDAQVVDTQTAEEKLGPELIAEIAAKDWKVAPLPSEEDLAKEKSDSPKARRNINSRKNLIQYREDKPVEVKEKIVKSIKYKKVREEVNPFDYIELTDEKTKKLLTAFLPERKVLKNVEEEKSFYTILNAYLEGFDLTELAASDIEDIVSLAVNRILENRLLALSSEDPNLLASVSQDIERFRKHSEKVKGNLATRRADRIDPRNKQNFSIVDLVYTFDSHRQQQYEERIKRNEQEEKEFIDKKSKRK